MRFLIDHQSIFEQLRKKCENEQEKINNQEVGENNPIAPPEDAQETDIVDENANGDTSEETHGGNEANGEILNSVISIENGKNADKENKTDKTHGNGEKQNSEEDEKEENDEEINENSYGNYNGNSDKYNHDALEKDIINSIEQTIYQKTNEEQDKLEKLKKYIVTLVNHISRLHSGVNEQGGRDKYDKKNIAKHLLTKQSYKIPNDKKSRNDAKKIQFFIDTSGVYGCSSNRILNDVMPEIVHLLELQGYECEIASCGNGFSNVDAEDEPYYQTRKKLEDYHAGNVSKIACPSEKTAAKKANEAEFSIILADFDGFSSFSRMAKMCQKDKVPYILSTEDRFPSPKEHNWNDPNEVDYPQDRIFDVSLNGLPTYEQYNEWLREEEEYYYNNCNANEDNDDYNDEDQGL